MKENFLDINGTKTRIYEWGSKERPTIICIHGLGGTSLSFLEVANLIKEKYHIFSVDLPGHGKTTEFKTDKEYEIPNLLKWLCNVIELIEKDDFYLMAHSWGGCIALHYAVNFPKKVKKILLLDGGYHVKSFEYEYFSKVDKSKLGFKPSCTLDEEIQSYESDFDGYVFSNWESFLECEKNNYLRWSDLLEVAAKDLMKKEESGEIRFAARGRTARGAIKSMYKYPTDELFDKIDVPILLLQATLPDGWREIRELQVKKFKEKTNSIVRVLEGTTHLIHWDNPELIAKYTMEWMR